MEMGVLSWNLALKRLPFRRKLFLKTIFGCTISMTEAGIQVSMSLWVCTASRDSDSLGLSSSTLHLNSPICDASRIHASQTSYILGSVEIRDDAGSGEFVGHCSRRTEGHRAPRTTVAGRSPRGSSTSVSRFWRIGFNLRRSLDNGGKSKIWS